MTSPTKYTLNSFLSRPKLLIFYGFCLAASLVGIYGLVVAVGWIRDMPSLVHLHSSLAPTPFNAGLLLFGLSLAMLTSLAKSFYLSRALAIFIFIYSLLLIIQILFHLDFGLDPPVFTENSSYWNKTPVNTVLSFFLLSFSIIIFTSSTKKIQELWAIGIACFIALGISLSAVFGLIDRMTRLSGNSTWIYITNIDIQSALGLFISSIVILYLINLKFRSTFPVFCIRLFSLLAFLIMLWSAIAFYMTLKNHENYYKKSTLDYQASQMLKFVIHQSEVDRKSIKRLQDRWNAQQDPKIDLWKKDAQHLIEDLNSLQGLLILKPDKTEVVSAYQKKFTINDLNKQILPLLDLKEENWHTVQLEDGKNLLSIYFLLNFPENEKGYLIAFYDVEAMITAYQKFILTPQISPHILYQDKTIYFPDKNVITNEQTGSLIISEQSIDNWKLILGILAPNQPSYIQFPEFFLGLGILLSFLSGSVFYLYQKFKRESYLLNKANAAKALFLANVSHEIRTPLHGVIGSASLLEFTELTPRQENLLRILQMSSNHLLDLINNLLDITKIESGSVELKYMPVDIRELAEEAIAAFSDKAAEKDLKLQLNFDFPEPQKIMIPARQVKQIINNLIGNAIKFTDSGTITLEVQVIKTAPINGKLNINVSDTGIGIPENQKRYIFDKFYQVNDADGMKHRGTGLGLFLTKLLVNEMKGNIYFKSTYGQGTTFYISVPITFKQTKD